MNKKDGCFYCERNEAFRSVLFEMGDLRASKVFLCKDQTLPGRCSIMFEEHFDEIYQIPEERRNIFIGDVCALAQTLKELFGADKINYAIYGDEVTHVHFNICPKYRGMLGWGGSFVLFPDEDVKVYLTDEEYRERMELIYKNVRAKLGL